MYLSYLQANLFKKPELQQLYKYIYNWKSNKIPIEYDDHPPLKDS
jgi:hypothetical protein